VGSLKAYRFRIYPDAKRQKEINLRIILAQRLYNKILERVKEEYGKGGKSKVNMAHSTSTCKSQ
jgi:Helix-turn-helix domain.